ncbi:MAG: endopeptidase La [bacterium]
MKLQYNTESIDVPLRLPIIPLRDVVVFPYMMYPLLIGREFTVNALQRAMVRGKQVLLVAQKRADIESPKREDLYDVGVVARILQVMKMPNGTLKVLVEGLARVRLASFSRRERYLQAQVEILQADDGDRKETVALARNVSERFAEYVRLNRRIPDEVVLTVSSVDDLNQRTDTIAAHLLHRIDTKQKILEAVNVSDRLRVLTDVLEEEIEILKIERKIDGNVRESMSRSQREYYLQQQLKAIKDELGQFDEPGAEVDDLFAKLEAGDFPEEVRSKADDEIKRLSKMHPYSAESGVVRSYLEWLLAIPWRRSSSDRDNFKEVKAILDGDHYGLQKAKERIIEHLAVMSLAGKVRGPILCLVGPPGVGKTSVGRSIARALGRNFVRMSLGGVHDEAEIRGHRRTYIGAMPGKIIQLIKKAGSNNPLLLLDEIDKIGSDFRGDPASALLEVLDPEQNCTFADNYLEVEFDLSNVLFITTANTTESIPPALKDRMEVIRLPGYLDFEKVAIARDYLVPKLKKQSGLHSVDTAFREGALEEIIRYYTREAGVRELERQMMSMLRKTAVEISEGQKRRRITYGRPQVTKALGQRKYTETDIKKRPTIGYAVGLAWTSMGGEVLPVEVVPMKGKAQLTLTGSLGDVMQESATAALSYVRRHAVELGLATNFYDEMELHIHIPEGAVPKDGPSAGITLLAALVSTLTKIGVRTDTAMTGEITLGGDVLPVGGLNEKLLAANRQGITRIVLPERNRKDIVELQKELVDGLELHFVRQVSEALGLVLTQMPTRRPRKAPPTARGTAAPH